MKIRSMKIHILSLFAPYHYMTSKEEIFEIAKKGDGYLAIEKSSFIIRKLKRQNKIDEAILFMMELANKMLDLGMFHDAGIAAYRSILLARSDTEFNDENQKQLFIDFANKMTPAASSPELYSFFRVLIDLTKDEDESLIRKEASIADEANKYDIASIAYLLMIRDRSEIENPPNDDSLTELMEKLIKVLYRWILAVPEDMREFNSQFVLCRPILAVLDCERRGPANAQVLLDQILIQKPDEIPDSYFSLPLVNFTRLFIKAVTLKSTTSSTFLITKYKPLLDLNIEIMKWVYHIKGNHFGTGNTMPSLENLSSLMSNMMGGLFGQAD